MSIEGKILIVPMAAMAETAGFYASYSEKMHPTFQNIERITRLGYSRFNKKKTAVSSLFCIKKGMIR